MENCWMVVGDHIYVYSGLPCCGTNGYSWGIAWHHAVHALASVTQQCISALLCHSPYGSTSYTAGTAPGDVTGQRLTAVGHNAPDPGCT